MDVLIYSLTSRLFRFFLTFAVVMWNIAHNLQLVEGVEYLVQVEVERREPWPYKSRLTRPLFIEVPVSRQESEWSCI